MSRYFERKLATNGATYFVAAYTNQYYIDNMFPCITGLSLDQADKTVDALNLAYNLGRKDVASSIIEFAEKI